MHHRTHTHTPHEHEPQPRTWLLPVLLVAQLMVILDITAVNIALPSLARELRIDGATISWTITSYSLIFGSLLLLGGRAADLLGRRRLFLTGLGIFTAASLTSALAGSAAALFAARAGQGLGAAMLSPAALSIITTTCHGQRRAKAFIGANAQRATALDAPSTRNAVGSVDVGGIGQNERARAELHHGVGAGDG